MSGLIAAGAIGAAASLAAAKMSADGAKAGGEAAARGAMEGAVFNANISRDQRMENRVDASPYMAAGRGGLNELGRLFGWGSLETGGGHDQWRYSTDPYGGSQGGMRGTAGGGWEQLIMPGGQGQGPDASKLNALTAMYGGALPTNPNFARLKVSATCEADPGYAFRLSEGQKALTNSAAARGKQLSGEQFKALEGYNSGLASQEYGNWWNRYTGGTQFNNAASQQEFGNALGLSNTQFDRSKSVIGDWMQLAGLGAGSTTSMAGQNTGNTNQVGNAFTSAGIAGGAARGAGEANSANAWASGIGSGFNNALTAAYLGGAFGKSSYTVPNSPASSVGPRGGTWS
jgi:hypothetical protein